MADTPVSLLDRLRRRPAAEDWERLVRLYEPFIRRLLAAPALRGEADDLAQDVLAAVVQHIPTFRRERCGAFRAWLRTIVVNRVNAGRRQRHDRPGAAGGTDGYLALLEVPDPGDGLSAAWDAEHDAHVARRLLELIEPEFTPATWQAFRGLAIDGRSAADVAADLSSLSPLLGIG